MSCFLNVGKHLREAELCTGLILIMRAYGVCSRHITVECLQLLSCYTLQKSPYTCRHKVSYCKTIGIVVPAGRVDSCFRRRAQLASSLLSRSRSAVNFQYNAITGLATQTGTDRVIALYDRHRRTRICCDVLSRLDVQPCYKCDCTVRKRNSYECYVLH